MRRRERVDEPDSMPSHLRVFNPADWAEARRFIDCGHAECAFWEAVEAWGRAHPDEAGPLIIVDGPPVPIHPGDVVQVLDGVSRPY